jgi:ADP-ribosyl-[dinitrogen reductase] hydrolase
LTAVNLGDDADTTGAIAGQIAGAFYGMEGIPAHWLERLWMKDAIVALAEAIYGLAIARC